MPTTYRSVAPEDAALAARLTLPQYPRSAGYNPRWALENLMGPNVLWLAEALSQALELTPGMRVLDLGCGKAASSVFFAREFDVQVWAADLWIGPSENWGGFRPPMSPTGSSRCAPRPTNCPSPTPSSTPW